MTQPARLSAGFSTGVFLSLIATLIVCLILPRGFSIVPGVLGVVALGLSPFFLKQENPAQPRPWSFKVLSPALIPALIILALAALSSLWAIDSAEALERTGKLAGVLLPGVALFGVLRVMRVDNLAQLWWVIPAMLAMMSAFLTSEYLSNYTVYRIIRDLPADQYVQLAEMNRSFVALCLLYLPGLALLYKGLRQRGVSRKLSVLAAAAFVGTIIPPLSMTDSQSATMALVLGGAVLLLAPVGRKSLWVVAALVACIGILSAPFLAQYLWSLTPHDLSAQQQIDFISKTNYLPRLELWDAVARYAMQSPWIGFGIEATRSVPAFDSQQIYQPGTTLLHPHNAALQIWIEFGALGAVLAAGSIALLCRACMNLPNQMAKRLGLALLVATMGVGVVGYGLWQGWWIGLLATLVAVSILSIRILSAQAETYDSAA
jgi:O-antigen ligase